MEKIITVAEFRKDVLAHMSVRKGMVGVEMGIYTPAVCLACENLDELGSKCTVGGDMYRTGRKWWHESSSMTPVTDICGTFKYLKRVTFDFNDDNDKNQV